MAIRICAWYRTEIKAPPNPGRVHGRRRADGADGADRERRIRPSKTPGIGADRDRGSTEVTKL
ncbi:hypothetical protein BN903_288 [Halorubrum sp. AJ67]|nr:hypothetical protein BN903_288 [Halorubrum sp. AJ67]